jgi:1-deoxy-D-xylulose 5-phosphate reductoisomerase
LLAIKKLEFLALDEKKFPCVRLMRECFQLGEGLPAAMNGINEVFVKHLLAEKISFWQVMQGYLLWMKLVKDQITKTTCPPFLKKINSLEDALLANEWGMDSFSKIRIP